MTVVLALTQDRQPSPAVSAVAGALAAVVGAGVSEVVVPRPGGAPDARGDPEVLRALRDPATSLVVLARDAPSPTGWEQVVREATQPVVVVPADLAPGRGVSRVLVPLDGTPEAAAAVAGTLSLFARVGADVVVLHVFDEATVPRFWDQAAHAGEAWGEEFLARHRAPPGSRLELRSGRAGEHVVDVAAAEDVDVITLGWSRHLDPGRARTVRATVAHAQVPVLLIPLPGA